MTRATVKLDLLVRAGNPFNARFLEPIQGQTVDGSAH